MLRLGNPAASVGLGADIVLVPGENTWSCRWAAPAAVAAAAEAGIVATYREAGMLPVCASPAASYKCKGC